jgi:AcrR family transcriptional regulator
MKEKLDRRVRRTRRMLSTAILELMAEHPYEALTIQEITDRADLNRATFYLHFSNKDELLIAALEERFDELVARFEDTGMLRHDWDDAGAELLAFQHVAEHAPLYRRLLGERGMGYVIVRVIRYIAEFSEEQLRRRAPNSDGYIFPPALIAQHVAGSIFALINWWLANDMPYPPEYMARLAHELCVHGILHALPEQEIPAAGAINGQESYPA